MTTSYFLQTAVGRAHSKLILIGEHAVVYGKPAIAIPFPLEVSCTVTDRYGEIMLASSHYVGPLHLAPKPLEGIKMCILETLKYLHKPAYGLLIRLSSKIPIGRGLGSSAAIAIAIVRGLFTYYGRPLFHTTLMRLVEVAEAYAHGTPSGIDMAASSSDRPIWFDKEVGPTPLKVGSPLYLAVGDTGMGSDTFSAVKSVREKYEQEHMETRKSLEKIADLAEMTRKALAEGDIHAIGRAMNENHEELRAIGVSNEPLDRLVETAREAGALGAKLTGGGRGGCMFALAESPAKAKRLTNALAKAGAEKTWYFTIGRK